VKRCHFLGFPYIAAGAPDLRHGRIALLLRAWPFSVAPRPLARRSGPADTLSARPDLMQGPGALLPPPGARPCKTFRGQAASAWVLGRRAPPWVVGVRRPMPSVANGFVFRRCGAGGGQRRLGGGPDDIRGGLSVSVVAVLVDVISLLL